MKKLAPDVYVFTTNAHTALLTSGRIILVDTGTKPDGSILLPDLAKAGYMGKDIESIIITHTHPDHVGGLAQLKEISNARIASHEVEAKFISKEETYQGPPGPDAQRHPGTPVDDLLQDGQVYEGLLVLHTPGHTLGHIALLDKENGILYAGDSMRNDSGKIAPMPDQFNINPDQHVESMRKLANYGFEKVVFGHGDPLSERGKRILEEFLKTVD